MLLVTVLATVPAGACNSPSDAAPGPTVDAPPESASSGPAGVRDRRDLPSIPTYYQDVAPILDGRCTQCHHDGGVATDDFTDVDIVRDHAKKLGDQVTSRAMPAWLPGPKTPPLLHAPTLTDAQIDTIATWVRLGAPLGDPANPAPPLEHEVVDIGATELGFDTGVDYQPEPTADDDYRCFLVELAASGPTTDRLATGFSVTAGNASVVHHVVTTFFDAPSKPALAALDAETPDRAGWPCFGAIVPEDRAGVTRVSTLGVWDPGASAVKLPEGTGSLVPAGALAVVQMHYRVTGAAPDRTRIDVALAPKSDAAVQPLQSLRVVARSISIPPETKDVLVEESATVDALGGGKAFVDGKGWIVAVSVQMQLLGVRATLELESASGVTTLLDVPLWNMDWPGTWQLATPIAVATTDTVRVRCVYDNTSEHHAEVKYTAPMHLVGFGDTLADEVCSAELEVVDGP